MKKFIVSIGYTTYACEQADAVMLLAIASRMRHVKQSGYSGPYYVQPDQEPWLDTITMADVIEPQPEPEADRFGAATKASSDAPF